MKKIYQSPFCLASELESEQVLCSSVGTSIDDLAKDDALNNLFN